MYFKWLILSIVLLSAGGTAGFLIAQHTQECNCPKDLSVALSGCEHAAIEVNRQLFATQWNLDACSEKLSQANEVLLRIMFAGEQKEK